MQNLRTFLLVRVFCKTIVIVWKLSKSVTGGQPSILSMVPSIFLQL